MRKEKKEKEKEKGKGKEERLEGERRRRRNSLTEGGKEVFFDGVNQRNYGIGKGKRGEPGLGRKD